MTTFETNPFMLVKATKSAWQRTHGRKREGVALFMTDTKGANTFHTFCTVTVTSLQHTDLYFKIELNSCIES